MRVVVFQSGISCFCWYEDHREVNGETAVPVDVCSSPALLILFFSFIYGKGLVRHLHLNKKKRNKEKSMLIFQAELTPSSCLENHSPYVSRIPPTAIYKDTAAARFTRWRSYIIYSITLKIKSLSQTALCALFHIKPFKKRKWALVLWEIDRAFGSYNDDNLKIQFFS